MEIEWTYSVNWRKEDTLGSARMEKASGGGLLPETFEVRCRIGEEGGRVFGAG